MGCAAVVRCECRWIDVKCGHAADADVEAAAAHDVAKVPGRGRTDPKERVFESVFEDEVMAAFLNAFDAAEERIFIEVVITL